MAGIFRAYDIRGSYRTNSTRRWQGGIGAAFARLMDYGSVAVGRDARLSSPALAEAFIRGFSGAGGSVTDFGRTSSPSLNFAVIRGKFAGGAMITASHLPPQMNGIKLCRDNAIPLSGDEGLPALEQTVTSKGENHPDRRPAGARHPGDMTGPYIDTLAGFVRDPRPLVIAADAGDGMAGPEINRFFAEIPLLKPVARNLDPDGRFPHHGANPFLPSATADLEELTRESRADLGVAFDGDADRAVFTDEQGMRVPANLIAALIAGYYLAGEPGGTILYDLPVEPGGTRDDPPAWRQAGPVPGRPLLYPEGDAEGERALCRRTLGPLLFPGLGILRQRSHGPDPDDQSPLGSGPAPLASPQAADEIHFQRRSQYPHPGSRPDRDRSRQRISRCGSRSPRWPDPRIPLVVVQPEVIEHRAGYAAEPGSGNKSRHAAETAGSPPVIRETDPSMVIEKG